MRVLKDRIDCDLKKKKKKREKEMEIYTLEVKKPKQIR